VLFGAGKIGRSFIGQIFSRAGYEVVFVDVDQQIIGELNRRHSYKVIIKSDEGDSEILVRNVRGVLADDVEQVKEELADCCIAEIHWISSWQKTSVMQPLSRKRRSRKT
jgi:mannitol-1-phosphate 5-dehydrogenase